MGVEHMHLQPISPAHSSGESPPGTHPPPSPPDTPPTPPVTPIPAMFAVDGWKLPNIVPQKADKKRKDAPDANSGNVSKKPKPTTAKAKPGAPAPGPKKNAKDKSKYRPYGKEKGSSGSNVVPVAKERKPRPKSPSPPPPPSKRPSKETSEFKRPEKKPLARPPRSERDKTPPKLIAADPPPSFSGLSLNKNLTPLQRKMAAKLSGARFRWINERLYTSSGADALKLIAEKPDMFDAYHAGFRSQVKDWPSNPIDIYLHRLESLISSTSTSATRISKTVIADLGCGEAMIARRALERDPSSKIVQVKSFDLLAANPLITACDISHLPLPDASIDICIFCLSLMSTDFLSFLQESHRVLKVGGQLWVSEIKSRFGDRSASAFVEVLKGIGFTLKEKDDGNKMFVRFDFVKGKEKRKKAGGVVVGEGESKKVGVLLKPCTYKKR